MTIALAVALGSCGDPGPDDTCVDGIQNQGEGGVDCGGPCPEACETCRDGIQNQGEGGVDCGGPCPEACESCWDGVQNQGEDGVDCGGPCFTACCTEAGNACQATSECCVDHTCVRFTDEHIVCAYNCTTASQCASGCCVDLVDGGGACGAGWYCGICAGPGDDCMPGDCCSGYRCVWYDYVGAICERNTPCPSECLQGSLCCRPPYCAGDCIGSPCCT